MAVKQPQPNPSQAKPFEKLSPSDREWKARVETAERAVTEAAEKMTEARTPALQHYAFIEYTEKRRALRQILRSK
jgi:hypothetical protein